MKQEIVQSVDRALNILEAIGENHNNLLEIANHVHLNKSTVHRLLQTLVYKGYVTQNDESLYFLTSKLIYLSQQVMNNLDIIEIAKPHLIELNKLSNEVVHLVMIEGSEAVYIDKIESNSNIRMYSYIGKRISLATSAVGKAYLAYTDERDRNEYLASVDEIDKLTEHTLSKHELIEEIEVIRLRGYAIDQEENEMGVVCVAAHIFDHKKNIKYAISISTPKFRITPEKLESYGKAVIKVTKEISKVLGA